MSLSYDHMPHDRQRGVNCSYRSQGEKGRKPFSEVVLLGIFGWHSEWEERANHHFSRWEPRMVNVLLWVGSRRRSGIANCFIQNASGVLWRKTSKDGVLSSHHCSNYFRHICQVLPKIIVKI